MERKHGYTNERNAQIVLALMKAHGIRRVVASPGSSGASILGSVQFDDWFKVCSAVDERHAAYMACGMADETGEPVALICTGSTASRNYIPALTEAFYRKLPILAITSAQPSSHVGNLWCQCLDRSSPPKDAVKFSVRCRIVKDDADAAECELNVNKAILELSRHGGGPVHIDLETTVDGRFSVPELPPVRKISRHFSWSESWPTLAPDAKVAVLVGAHRAFSGRAASALERFVASRNAVVLCTAPCSYHGLGRVSPSLVCSQKHMESNPRYAELCPDVVVHIGEMTNDYALNIWLHRRAAVWRVSEDGEIRDRYGRLENVFEVDEATFFARYANGTPSDSCRKAWEAFDAELRAKLPELPFSNPWIASRTLANFPAGAVLHLGMSTTYQSWNSFLSDAKIQVHANVGCCGIDGSVSALIGGALAVPDRLHFGVVGDLTFFYDLNSIGNRHVAGNVRILLVNNGMGALFRHPGHVLDVFGDDRDEFFGAAGHFGNKSRLLVKHYAEDLGFEYLSASTKDEFDKAVGEFLKPQSDRPILFECFTEVDDECLAVTMRTSVDPFDIHRKKRSLMDGVKSLFGEKPGK